MISSLDKVKRRASRIGFQPVKFITTIVVHQLVLPVENHIKNNSVLSICFEKGGKISTSDDIVYDLDQTDINLVERGSSNMSMVIELDERLELVSTLYRDPLTGIFQKKQGKIILRQLQTSPVTGMSSFKGIGIYTINLHEVAQSMGYDKMISKDLEMPLEQLSGASLEATVTNKIVYLQSEDDADDAHSVNSLASDMSTVGATFFSYDDVTDYVCQDEIVGMSSYVDSSPSHLRRGSGVHIARVVVGSYERKFNPISRRPSAAVFVEGSESTPTVGSSLSKVFDSMLPVEDDDHSSSNSIDHHSSDVNKSLQASNTDDEEQMVIGPTVDDDTTTSSTAAAASTPAAYKSLDDSRPSLEESSSSSSSIAVEAVSSPVMKRAVMVHRGTTTHEDFAFVEYTRSLAPKTMDPEGGSAGGDDTSPVKGGFYSDTFQYYEKELETRAIRIADLEQQALEQSNAYKSEVISLRAELTAMQAEYQLSAIVEEDDEEVEEDVDSPVVSSPNNATKATDSPPIASNWTTNRKSINRKSFMSSSSGVSLNPMSNMDDLLSEYGQVTAKLKTTERDLEYYKQLAMDMVKAKTDETLAAREAATVAVQACMKRAEVEQELDDALFQLEESQKDCSRLNKELISEQQRNATLRTRIQKYAKELGKMEVSYVLSINPEEGSDQSSNATHRRR